MYSNCCCSCLFEPEIIKIGQSSLNMYSNNILNFQESTLILNACTKTVWKLIECITHIYIYIYIYVSFDLLNISFSFSVGPRTSLGICGTDTMDSAYISFRIKMWSILLHSTPKTKKCL